MTESEFMKQADATLEAIERALEEATDTGEVDVECSRSGNVLEIEFVENGTKIIVNSQTPMQELWVAAKAGGYHYRREDGHWVDTRAGTELFAALSHLLSEQGGRAINLQAPSL